MEVKITWDMTEVKELMKRLKELGMSTTRPLVSGALVISAHAKINANAQGLHKTGDLINSIDVYDTKPHQVKVGSRGVIYAAVHEYGATIKPKRAKALSWINKTGERVFAMRVVIPARPYLRPAVDENIPEIERAISRAVVAELEGH